VVVGVACLAGAEDRTVAVASSKVFTFCEDHILEARSSSQCCSS
jgi:hypothetical protein